MGMLGVVLYAAQELGSNGLFAFLAVVSTGCLLGGASACVGGTLGFLFGIPRTLQQEGPGIGTSSNGNAPTDGVAGARRIDYLANTNLEQISDWLTKILVGIGLTQIPQLRENMGALTKFAAVGLGSGVSSQLFAFALISYSTVIGFLFGYLWARLFLVGALRLADQAAIGALVSQVKRVTERTETTERKLEELANQTSLDAEALSLAYRQLNPSAELQAPTQDALDKALAAASRPIRVQIFNQASQLRSESWRNQSTKAAMERTIAIFRALILSDTENKFHRNHAQLGYALKDSGTPDWLEAEKELSRAIEIRGPWWDEGWLFYEFNRAICRIMLDPNFNRHSRSGNDERRAILEDLQAAANVEQLRKLAVRDPVIAKWTALNNVTEKSLRENTAAQKRRALRSASGL